MREPVNDPEKIATASRTNRRRHPVSPRTRSKRLSRFITRMLGLWIFVAALVFNLISAYSKGFPLTQTAEQTSSIVKQDNRSDDQMGYHQQPTTERPVIASSITDASMAFFNGKSSSYNATSVTGATFNRTTSSNITKVAWLMSFPNSGTSYTLVMVRNSSRTATATNYGREQDTWDEDGNSMPVFDKYKGPFWISPADVDLPTKVVLTKTHCGGSSSRYKHFKSQLRLNLDSFLLHCRRGRVVRLGDNKVKQFVLYDQEIVGKAIHLIRHPLDNIVARFHDIMKSRDVNQEFVSNRESFRSYCSKIDQRLRRDRALDGYVDETVLKMLERVPCHFELILYLNWHDRAFRATDELRVPTHVLHYEDYSHNFNKTQAEILKFLDLEQRGEPPLFVKGKQYEDYFSQQERHAAQVALKALASDRTWQHIQHYFGTNGEAPMAPV